MAKGKRRAAQEVEKRQRKFMEKESGTSKYAQKRMHNAQGQFAETSPFYLDPSNPFQETVEQARAKERRHDPY